MHDTITVGIPVLAILFGILWNQQGIRDLRVEMVSRFTAVDARLDRMQADLSQFYRDLGDHGARIEMLEKKQS